MIRRALLFTAVLAAATIHPTTARASAPSTTAHGDFLPTTIELDASELRYTTDTAKYIGIWVEKKLADEHGVPMTTPADAEATLRIKLSWDNEEQSDWRIEVAVDRGGETSKVEPFICKGCVTEVEVSERIYAELPKIVPLLEAAAPEPGPAPEPAAASAKAREEPPGADDAAPDRGRPPRPLGVLGKVGIPLMVVGAGALGGGIAMIVRGTARDDDEILDTHRATRNFRPPGIAVAAAGGALLTTGIALLVVDRVRGRARQTALVPSVSPWHAGLSLHARF